MAMNFFDHQDQARKQTGRLVFIYTAAVASLVTLAWLTVAALTTRGFSRSLPMSEYLLQFALVAAGVLGVIGFGSFFKWMALQAGGSAIAESLGGRLLHSNTQQPLERKILNIVEEMSIASGCPMPAVYLLEKEEGINAFAAGFTIEDAAIGITRGCAEQLSRDELQGVVAHEFSHIINGDMKLNLRLIGILAGITLLTYIGYFMFRSAALMTRGRSNSKESGGAAAAFFVIGLVLFLLGFLGGLAAALIQAAISRQREFLADASAVQFTRNPDGIGGALKRIGGFASGSAIEDHHASETRHMFFSMAMSSSFSTHPPIEERIKRIDASWEHEQALAASAAAGTGPAAGTAGFAGQSAAAPSPAATKTPTPPAPQAPPIAPLAVPAAEDVVQTVGRPTSDHVEYARTISGQIPNELSEFARDPFSSRAVVFALLLDRSDDKVRERQFATVKKQSLDEVFAITKQLQPTIAALDRRLHLPLAEITKAALREMPRDHYHAFKDTVAELIAADKKISLFEWCLQRSLMHHLDAHIDNKLDRAKSKQRLGNLANAARLLLSTIAYAGHATAEEAATSYDQAMKGTGLPWAILPAKQCSLTTLDACIDKLAHLLPRHKEKLVQACVACALADDKISINEAEMLRAITEMLQCPLPPLIPTT